MTTATLPPGCTTECRHVSMDTSRDHRAHTEEDAGIMHTLECNWYRGKTGSPCAAGLLGSNCRVGLAGAGGGCSVTQADAPPKTPATAETQAATRAVPLADLHALRAHLMFIHGWLVGHGDEDSAPAESIRIAIDIIADKTGGARTSAERSG